jgi:phosphate transport system permease protein
LLKKLFAWVRVVLRAVAKFFARLQKSVSQIGQKLSTSAKPSTVNKKQVEPESTMPLLAPAVAPTFTEELAPQVRPAPVAPAMASPLNHANQEPASQARPPVLTLAKYLAVIQTLTHQFVSQFLAFAKSSAFIQKLVSRVKKQFTPRDNGPVIRNGETVRTLKAKSTRIDKIFRAIATSSGGLTVGVMLAVGLFLGFRALTAIDVAGLSFLTEQSWSPETQTFGVAAVLFGTVTIALIALSISVPLSIGTALLISMVVSERTRRFLISLVDLMAAVPSVIFGLWGVFFLQANIIPVSRWISDTFGWIPIFSVTNDAGEKLIDASAFTSSAFIAGIVVSLMVVPTQTSIMREAFMQTPIGEREGALALGATRWSMITTVVLPFGKGGMVGGTMLGLGRALGETIAVYMIISPVFVINWQLLKTGTNSVSSLIALRYGEASEFGISALMAAGLVLFLITLVINFAASTIVARSRSGAEG